MYRDSVKGNSLGPHPLAQNPDDGGHDGDGGGSEGRGGHAGHILHDGHLSFDGWFLFILQVSNPFPFPASSPINRMTHPEDVHPSPVETVGQNEDVGRWVGGFEEVEDHHPALEQVNTRYVCVNFFMKVIIVFYPTRVLLLLGYPCHSLTHSCLRKP